MTGRVVLRGILLSLALGALPALATTSAAAESLDCPAAHVLTVGELLELAPGRWAAWWGPNPRGHACFGGSTIRLAGFANWPDGIGGVSSSGIKPIYFEWPQLYLFATDREVAPGYGNGSFYGIVVPPRMGRVDKRFRRMWVEITARFEDRLADRCRGYGPAGERPTRAEAIAECRDYLVLVSIARASGPPDTGTSAVAAGSSSDHPADPWPGALLTAGALVGAAAGWRRVVAAAR